MAQFYTLLTQVGQAKLANAMALGEQISISQLAVGDGGGTLPTPDSDRTALINEQRRAPINLADVDPDNPNWIVVEQVLPPDVGGWTIREIGVFDSAGDLIAYGNYPETYKPTLDEGSGRTQTVRMVLQVSDTAAVTLRVDPSVVLATRQYVDDGDQTVAQGAANALQEHVEADEAHAAQQISIETIQQIPDAATVQEALAALAPRSADFATEATLTSADNVIVMTGIVAALELEVGDVIQIIGGGDNDGRLHTVESITDDDTIIVNYEHCGDRGAGSLMLSEYSGNLTVRRIAKWFSASPGLGQAWVDVTDFRSAPENNWGATYFNTTGRTIEVSLVSVHTGSNVQAGCFIRVDGWALAGGVGSQHSDFASNNYGVIATVPFNSPYQFQRQTSDTGFFVRELR